MRVKDSLLAMKLAFEKSTHVETVHNHIPWMNWYEHEEKACVHWFLIVPTSLTDLSPFPSFFLSQTLSLTIRLAGLLFREAQKKDFYSPPPFPSAPGLALVNWTQPLGSLFLWHCLKGSPFNQALPFGVQVQMGNILLKGEGGGAGRSKRLPG